MTRHARIPQLQVCRLSEFTYVHHCDMAYCRAILRAGNSYSLHICSCEPHWKIPLRAGRVQTLKSQVVGDFTYIRTIVGRWLLSCCILYHILHLSHHVLYHTTAYCISRMVPYCVLRIPYYLLRITQTDPWKKYWVGSGSVAWARALIGFLTHPLSLELKPGASRRFLVNSWVNLVLI